MGGNKQMATSNQYFDLVQTGKSSWVAVRINPTAGSKEQTPNDQESEKVKPNDAEQDGIFSDSTASRITFSERFPRLTIAMIALIMIGATVTTEVDLLRGAGFFWQ